MSDCLDLNLFKKKYIFINFGLLCCNVSFRKLKRWILMNTTGLNLL